MQIETLKNSDIAGKHQQGFKINRSNLTLSLQLQSIIAGALDEDNYVAIVSLDLSAAFDVVNIELLLKHLRVLGLPDDVVGLIEIWLKTGCFMYKCQISTLTLSKSIPVQFKGPFLAPFYAQYL